MGTCHVFGNLMYMIATVFSSAFVWTCLMYSKDKDILIFTCTENCEDSLTSVFFQKMTDEITLVLKNYTVHMELSSVASHRFKESLSLEKTSEIFESSH